MTYQNAQMARGARQLKAVAALVALIAVTLAGLILALAPHEARPETLLVCVGMLGIAIFMWTYAARPGLYTGREGVFDDPLRTHYRAAAPVDCAPVDRTPAGRDTAQAQVVEIAPRGQVWTREYASTLARQAGVVVGGLLTFALAVTGVTLGLGESVGATWFLAAAIILPVGFVMSHRCGIVDSAAYPTEQITALPDLAWNPDAPVLAAAPVPAVVHAA